MLFIYTLLTFNINAIFPFFFRMYILVCCYNGVELEKNYLRSWSIRPVQVFKNNCLYTILLRLLKFSKFTSIRHIITLHLPSSTNKCFYYWITQFLYYYFIMNKHTTLFYTTLKLIIKYHNKLLYMCYKKYNIFITKILYILKNRRP